MLLFSIYLYIILTYKAFKVSSMEWGNKKRKAVIKAPRSDLTFHCSIVFIHKD